MLEIPLWGQRLAGFGVSDPFRTDVNNGTPKIHFLHQKHVSEQSLTSCDSVRAVREHGRRKKSKGPISRMCLVAAMQPVVMIFGTARDLADITNRPKDFIDRFKDFVLRKGQN